jgi:hypothetical protein
LVRRLAQRIGNRVRREIPHRWLAPVFRPAMGIRRGNVVMFHIGRSGSTVLASLLQQNPGVYWDGELLEGYYGTTAMRMQERGLRTQFRWNSSRFFPDDPVGFVRSRMPLAGFRSFYGFEAKFYHLTFNNLALADFVSGMEDLGFHHFVVLERKNFLRKVVSSLVAQQTLEYHLAPDRKPKPTHVHVNVEALEIDSNQRPLLEYFQEWEEQFASLKELLSKKSALWLHYETDLLTDPLIGYRRCCEFLDLPAYQANVRLGRTNPFPLQEIVSNWQEIAALLTGTRFEWMVFNPE